METTMETPVVEGVANPLYPPSRTQGLVKGREYRDKKKAEEAARKEAERLRLEAESKLEVPPFGSVADMLREDMHFVYTMPESRDDTEGKRRCRAWLKAKPVEFLSKLEGIAEEIVREKAAAARVKEEEIEARVRAEFEAAAKKEEGRGPDGGRDKAVALLTKLLEERFWEKGEEEEGEVSDDPRN